MSNSEYREPQERAREFGLKARHELRLENATYTAAEVKVLTDAALLLGRKEALDEVKLAIELSMADNHDNSIHQGLWRALCSVEEAQEKP